MVYKSSRAILICSPKIKRKKTTKKHKKSLIVCLNGQRKAVRAINFFEIWGKLGLDTGDFNQGLSSAQNDLQKITGAISNFIGYAGKIDSFLTEISDGVVKTTGEIIIESAKFAKSFDDAVMGVMSQVGSTVMGVFGEMATAATTFFTESIQEGMSFDAAMGQTSATLLKTREDFDAETVSIEGFTGTLRELAKLMGSTTKFTATQAGEALNYMALAGYSTQTSAEMLEKVLALAAAGAIDLATASDMVTDAQTALGIKMEDMTVFIDQMAKTASSSNTSVQQLGDALLSIGATGRTVKGGFTELNTVLGVLANNGIKASEGGNMLRRVLMGLQGNTDKIAELGVEVYDTSGKMRELPSIFMELDKALDKLSDKERDKAISDIFSQYSLAGANALLETTAEQWGNLTNKILDSKDAAKAMADIQLDTLPGQITILQSALSGLKIELFEKVAPLTKKFVISISDGLSEFTQLFSEGKFKRGFYNLADVFSNLLNDAVNAFFDNKDSINDFATGLLIFLKNAGKAAFEKAIIIVPQIVEMEKNLATTAIRFISDFFSDDTNVGKLQTAIQLVLNTIRSFFEENQDELYNIISTVFDLAVGFIDDIFLLKRESIYSILFEKFSEILDNLTENINAYLNSDEVQTAVDNVLSFIGTVATKLIESMPVILPAILDFVIGIATKALTGLSEFMEDEENLNTLRATINLLITKVEKFLDDNEENIYNIFSKAWDMAIGFVWRIFKLKRKTVASTLGRKIKEILSSAWGATGGIKDSLIKLGSNFLGGITSGLWASLPNLLADIGNIGEQIINKFEEFFDIGSPSKVMERRVGKFLAQGIGSGFEKEMTDVSREMTNVSKEAVKAIPTEFDINSISQLAKNTKKEISQFNNVFNIGSVNANSEQDAENFAKNVSKLLYNDIVRSKRGVYT